MKKAYSKLHKLEQRESEIRIGQFLRHLRNKFRLTQEYIAKKIGVSRPTLNKIESDKAELTLQQAKKLADFYNIPLINLILGKDSISVDTRKNLAGLSNSNEEESTEDQVNELTALKSDYRENLKDEVVLYLCIRLMGEPLIFEMDLKKILFLIDVEAMEKILTPLPGFKYAKGANGPEPQGWQGFIEKMIAAKIISRVNVPPYKYPFVKLLALREPRFEILKAREFLLIDEIITTYKMLDKDNVQENIDNIKSYAETDLYQEIHYK